MADDDDNLDDFKTPPGTNQDADQQLDAKALKLVEEYVASLNRSSNENEARSNIRDNVSKLGIHTLAFQHELNALRMMDKSDRSSYMTSRRRMGRILADKGESLFPDDVERIKKRKQKAAAKTAKDADAGKKEGVDQTAPDSPRSDPKRGGAGGVKGRGKAKDKAPKGTPKEATKTAAQAAADRAEDAAELAGKLREVQNQSSGASPGETGDELIARVAREKMAALEQREGDAYLTGHIDAAKSDAAEPLSQSAKSAAILDELGLNK